MAKPSAEKIRNSKNLNQSLHIVQIENYEKLMKKYLSRLGSKKREVLEKINNQDQILAKIKWKLWTNGENFKVLSF